MSKYTMSDRHMYLAKTPTKTDLEQQGFAVLEWVCPVCEGTGEILALVCADGCASGWKPLADVDRADGSLPCGHSLKDGHPEDITCPHCEGRKMESHRVTLKGLAAMLKELGA